MTINTAYATMLSVTLIKTNMFPLLISPLSILLTLTTSFGVLLHDTQLDRATTLALPAVVATFAAADIAMKLNDPHIHTERVSVERAMNQLRSNQPRLQVRGEDDKKYISAKKFVSDGLGSEYHWPSV